MYVTPSRLDPCLTPADYTSAQAYEAECASVLRPAWHVVGTVAELSRPGDFLTCELFGRAVQVRNFDGELRALSNVCAHRHCLISDETHGHSETMRCPYHGWEYGADGLTRKIPAAQNFRPSQKGSACLPVYRVDTCGGLVFVSVDQSQTVTLDEFLGDFHEQLESRFPTEQSPALVWNAEFAVNWKVIVENTLEAYHVPFVHPETFREDPGEDRSEHILLPNRTAMRTQLPFSPHSKLDAWFQQAEGRFLSWLGRDVTGGYEQHHLFPNLLFSFTDTLSLCHAVIPTGPTTCRSVVRQFGIRGETSGIKKWCVKRWDGVAAWLTKRVLLEDASLFDRIQKGLTYSEQNGIIGRCEERIYAFQLALKSQQTNKQTNAA